MALAAAPVSSCGTRDGIRSGESDAPPAEVGGGAPDRVWPSSQAAYWALFVIILATFLNFFDQTVFGMLAQRIKVDFGLSDEQLGFLGGPASIVFFVFAGIPLARLADLYPRKLVLAGGMAATGAVMGLGGVAQGFGQFVGSRMFLGAGGAAHAPAAYSMLADYFPKSQRARALAAYAFGIPLGTAAGALVGGLLAVHFGWRTAFIAVGAVGVLLAPVFRLVVCDPRPRR